MSLSFEIIFTRVLALMFENTFYAFSLMLSVYLMGLGLGAWAGAVFSSRGVRLQKIFYIVLLGTGLYGLSSCYFSEMIAGWYRGMESRASSGIGWTQYVSQQVMVCMVLLFPVSSLLGSCLPAAIGHLKVQAEQMERTCGRLYAINTLGSILGAFITGFILITFWGTQTTLYIMCTIALVMSFMIVKFFPDSFKGRKNFLPLILWGIGSFANTLRMPRSTRMTISLLNFKQPSVRP